MRGRSGKGKVLISWRRRRFAGQRVFHFPPEGGGRVNKKGKGAARQGKAGPKVQNKRDFGEFEDLKEVKNCWSVG